MDTKKATTYTVYLGRIFFALAFLALLGAWLTQATGGTLLGMSQQHLFNDAIVLSLFGIGMFLDALWHWRNV
ncbi:MAG: hypothetical protein ACR2N3_07260 [Pyrinomonadaceae bacterium]